MSTKSKKQSSKSKEKSSSKEKNKSQEKSPPKEKEKEKKTKQKKSKKDKKKQQAKEEKQSIQQTKSLQSILISLCVHHKTKLSFFCDSCQEPICNSCISFGPHNNQLHKIIKLQQAYKLKQYHISQAIRTNLLHKRDGIIAQLHRLQYRCQQIKYIRSIIQRDIRADFGSKLEHLNSVQGTKLALFYHEMATIQKEIDFINQVGNRFFKITYEEGSLNEQKAKCMFLKASRNLYEASEYMLKKKYKIPQQISIDDLPRDMEQEKHILMKAYSFDQVLQFKNELIWKLRTVVDRNQKLDKIEERVKQQLENLLEKQLQSWNELTIQKQNKIKSFQLVCHFCGLLFKPTQIGKRCEGGQKTFSQMSPTEQQNEGVHLFGEPTQKYRRELLR